MKKFIYLILLSILILPITVNAAVDVNTTIGLFETDAECRAELAKNDKNQNSNATTGYYLSCIAVSCGVNERITHQDIEPLRSNVTCTNGNTDPYVKSWKTAVPTTGELAIGATCSLDEEDENFVMAQFATKVDQYNCLQKANGDNFQGSTVNNPSGNNNNNNNNVEANPKTSINTYYTILGSTVILLSVVLYVVNKKNLFKKI